MKSRFNIALIPISQSDSIVRFAGQFSSLADSYFLGEKSLPHLTLCQFTADDAEAMETWERVCEALHSRSIELTFNEFSCISVDNSSWVSLLPHSNKELQEMHNTVASIVKSPLGRIFKNYDPHLTLLNTKQQNYRDSVEEVKKAYIPIKDTFFLALGRSDQLGQFTEVLCRAEARERVRCRL